VALHRVDFQGTLHGIEQFQHGHHVQSAGSANEVAVDAATRWSTLIGTAGINTFFNTGIVWSQVNVSELGTTPADPIVQSAQAVIGLGGLSADNGLPPQVSPCVSLNTVTAGSRARGRMFLPAPDESTLTSAGRVSSAFRTALVAGLETYFEGLATDGHDLVVVSSVGAVYTAYSVITIRMGDVFDVQRRRRNSIAEVYTSASI
jgi:hypothetical protein